MHHFFRYIKIGFFVIFATWMIMVDARVENAHSTPSLPSFSGIDVGNNFQVVITHGKHQRVELIGDPRAIARVSAVVKKGTLVLGNRSSSFPGYSRYRPLVLVKIVIATSVSYLKASGNAQIYAKGIYSNGLCVITKDQGSIILQGKVNLAEVQSYGVGDISISRINSHHVLVTARGSGRIRLGGSVNVLTARISGGSQLYAQYLPAREVYITADDFSLAEVYPVLSLYAFASGHSQIYYYRTPRILVLRLLDSGTVLRINGRSCSMVRVKVPIHYDYVVPCR
jgi:Putative auto-transporter adhesin, head GIN domain